VFYVDHFDQRCIGTELKFLFFPQRCFISGKRLWLEKAYKSTAMYLTPDGTVFEHRYYDKYEYLMFKLEN